MKTRVNACYALATYHCWLMGVILLLATMVSRGASTESLPAASTTVSETDAMAQVVNLRGDAGGKRFDGMGIVNGGGATSVLLKDYPEPQRSQILDMVYKPKFGASVSALLVEIPGDGNSTQGSMPSHMRTRDDLNYQRGYMWWILKEAKKRNPKLSLDAVAWSAPGWLGDGSFWSQDTADYYIKWLQGLRSVYGLEFDAIGCRNEKGVSAEFAKILRSTLNANGFRNVKLHGFDNWPKDKFDFIKDMESDTDLRNSLDILSAHTLESLPEQINADVQIAAAKWNKPIWNTEGHVYKMGYDDEISIVQTINLNYIIHGSTKIVNWYDIAGIYEMEPYSEAPPMLLARTPWSGNYQVREAVWGYAHYGQFSEIGWQYLNDGSGHLSNGGTFVTLKSPSNDYSIILETKGAQAQQQVRFQVSGGLSTKELCVWRSNAHEQFIRQASIKPVNGVFTIVLDPESIYSISTTTGQKKGMYDDIPTPKAFPFPYLETFKEYTYPAQLGYLPHYLADIAGVFEIADCPIRKGKCLRQVIPIAPIAWAPEWLPYTLVGDKQWQDYEVSSDIYLNYGDSAGVMGRVNDVGTGFGSIPKGYFLKLDSDGQLRLVVVRGKKSKRATGDAEQQALFKASAQVMEYGEKELSSVQLPNIAPHQWHNVKLGFEGSTITGYVDGKPVLSVTDTLYTHGMAALLAGGDEKNLSTPFYANLLITSKNAPEPKPLSAMPGQMPIYAPR